MVDNLSYSEWCDKITGADFRTASTMIKDKIKTELDVAGQKFLDDMYDYFISHYESGKDIKLDTLKTHMVEVKGNDNFNANQLMTYLMLMALCGFNMKDFK